MAKPSKNKQPGVERSDTPGFRKRSGIDPKGIAEPCICDPFGIRLFCFASLSGGVAALNPRLCGSDAFGIASKMSKLQAAPCAGNPFILTIMRLKNNPAAGLIRDELVHRAISNAQAA